MNHFHIRKIRLTFDNEFISFQLELYQNGYEILPEKGNEFNSL